MHSSPVDFRLRMLWILRCTQLCQKIFCSPQKFPFQSSDEFVQIDMKSLFPHTKFRFFLSAVIVFQSVLFGLHWGCSNWDSSLDLFFALAFLRPYPFWNFRLFQIFRVFLRLVDFLVRKKNYTNRSNLSNGKSNQKSGGFSHWNNSASPFSLMKFAHLFHFLVKWYPGLIYKLGRDVLSFVLLLCFSASQQCHSLTPVEICQSSTKHRTSCWKF